MKVDEFCFVCWNFGVVLGNFFFCGVVGSSLKLLIEEFFMEDCGLFLFDLLIMNDIGYFGY